jgi:hypothetical protein
VTEHEVLSIEEYYEAMMDKLDEIPENWLRALREIVKEKIRVARAYNRMVWEKSFQIGDLVWKTILPMGT